ncbi:MAG: PadR family transcriptional regulator [Candidatus Aenigmarchaeota archaeon]|nr:PadR family transcriptional regulator [Candidatus Aenigmarchaeota archaeon]MDI6721994.1 PadR family transcriptional regulator [Candidatus Aenigmarchaeota archaeon]
MRKVKIDNMARFYALMLLHEKNRHGYEMIKIISEKTGKRISPGHIYPFLKEMRKSGIIEVKKEGSREKTIYTLTPWGKRFVKEMLLRFSEMISIAVRKDISVCRHCSCEIYKGGYRKGGAVFCCKSCAEACK